MPVDHLTNRERAVLLTLMAEARELTNAELHGLAGLTLDGEPRRRLNERKLVTSTRFGRSYAHELTDAGWRWCSEELGRSTPPRANSLGGALYRLMAGLRRHFDQTGEQLSEIFQPDLEELVRGAYARLAGSRRGYVGLAELREALVGVSREEVDAELERLAGTPGVHVVAEPNQKALTDDDRAASVRFGGDERHMLKIESR